MGNKRIFYACHGVALDGSLMAGVQSVTVSSETQDYAIETFGSTDIDEIYKDQYTFNINVQRAIVSEKIAYYPTGTIDSVANQTFDICLLVGSDTAAVLSSGNTSTTISFPKCKIDSVAYNLDVDGNFTEEITFLGFSKHINSSGCADIGPLAKPTDSNEYPYRRQHFESSTLGGNLSNVSATTSFNFNKIKEFGKSYIDPNKTYPTYPIITQLSVTKIYTSGNFDSIEENNYDTCVSNSDTSKENHSIDLCGSTTIHFSGCILKSTDYNGGDTGGGNVLITKNYDCYNGFRLS